MTPDHEQLLEEMSIHLVSRGYRTISAAYADICDDESKKMLSRMYSVPATYVRTRSDRIAFDPRSGNCFEFDAKTNLTERGDVFVELLPVVAHYAIGKWFGLRTIYGFRWPTIDRTDIGFAIDDTLVDMVTTIFLFGRDCQVDVNIWVESMAPHVFKNAEIVKLGRCRGSGDPAIKIEPDKLEQLPHWKDVFNAMS